MKGKPSVSINKDVYRYESGLSKFRKRDMFALGAASLLLASCSNGSAAPTPKDADPTMLPEGAQAHKVDVSVDGSVAPIQEASVANSSVESIDTAGVPSSWSALTWGDNDPTFSYVTGDAHSGESSVLVNVDNYKDGDAKWAFAPLTKLVPDRQYSFSDWYKTNSEPQVVVYYTTNEGEDKFLKLPSPDPEGAEKSWQHYSENFYLPKNAASATVFMLLESDGWLQTDDYEVAPYKSEGFEEPVVSLTFDDGWRSVYSEGLPLLNKYDMPSTQYLISDKLNTEKYMTDGMVDDFIEQGSEVASHTVSHSDLTSLSVAALKGELRDSQAELRQKFGENVADDFASPYGKYNNEVITEIDASYESHRSTDVGFNDKKSFNPYNIRVQNVKAATTPDMVQAWVNEAKRTDSWLVLVYHQVIEDTSAADYSVTLEDFETQLSMVKQSGVEIKTVEQALDEILPQLHKKIRK